MKLIDIAHARSGDKGNISNIAVFAYDSSRFALLAKHLTADRVRRHFGTMIRGKVERFELPPLGALNFVLHDALDGGVNQSLALDTHGKCFASILLEIELPDN
jgi:hypothetical protein